MTLPLLALTAVAAPAQTVDDGLLMPRRGLATGVVFGHESWSEYWEGSRKRDNENIGALRTQSASWVAAYGATDRLSLFAMLPYMRTQASAGTLKGMQGVQDLTLAAKYSLLSTPLTDHGTMTALLAGAVGSPIGDYSPDFLPLSIGLASRRASGRFTVDFQAHRGWFLAGSAAHTWRGNVHLDRPAYYTDGRLYLTSEVAMPNVFDYTVSGGYRKGRLHIPISLTEQYTLGGGDIRRNDMPFVSNRMDFTRLNAGIGYALPGPNLMIQAGAGHVLSGRNVGQATGVSGGVVYTRHF